MTMYLKVAKRDICAKFSLFSFQVSSTAVVASFATCEFANMYGL